MCGLRATTKKTKTSFPHQEGGHIESKLHEKKEIYKAATIIFPCPTINYEKKLTTNNTAC